MYKRIRGNAREYRGILENTGEYKRIQRKYRGNTIENEKRNRETHLQGI